MKNAMRGGVQTSTDKEQTPQNPHVEPCPEHADKTYECKTPPRRLLPPSHIEMEAQGNATTGNLPAPGQPMDTQEPSPLKQLSDDEVMDQELADQMLAEKRTREGTICFYS